ncbi:MAG: hypothetical protein HYU66_15035 [Armatimonadetes bacterium]|nr:hypothetical protein [Armatimonadota bacterium]
MTPLLLSSLFPELAPTELASLAHELGFAGLDLAVHGLSRVGVERTLTLLAGSEAPAQMLTLDGCEAAAVAPWLRVAGEAGIATVRTAPWPADTIPAPRLAELAELAAQHDLALVVPNHTGSSFQELERLTAALEGLPPERLSAALAPDQLPRSRAGDHGAWLAGLALPAVGVLVLAGYRWTSEVGAGNVCVWTPEAAVLPHGLTPWAAWLERLRELGFDGLCTFGDPTLTGPPGERLRILRDDLRYVRRIWFPGRGEPVD